MCTAALQQGWVWDKTYKDSGGRGMKREQMCDRERAMSGNGWIKGNNSASGVSMH